MTQRQACSGRVTWDEARIFADLNAAFWEDHRRNPTDEECAQMVSSAKAIDRLAKQKET